MDRKVLQTIRYLYMYIADRSMPASVDVYSFGMTMWVIAQGNGVEPFRSGLTSSALTYSIANGGWSNSYTITCIIETIYCIAERPPIGESWPRQVSDLIQKCWRHAPKERPSFDDIVAELLFLDLDWLKSSHYQTWQRKQRDTKALIQFSLSLRNK